MTAIASGVTDPSAVTAGASIVANTVIVAGAVVCPADGAGASSVTVTASGLQYEDTKVGTGPTPRKGEYCEVHYTGWLWTDGKKGKNRKKVVELSQPVARPVSAPSPAAAPARPTTAPVSLARPVSAAIRSESPPTPAPAPAPRSVPDYLRDDED